MLSPDEKTPSESESGVIRRLASLLGDLSGTVGRIAPALETAKGVDRALLIVGLVHELGTLIDLTIDTRNAIQNLKDPSC